MGPSSPDITIVVDGDDITGDDDITGVMPGQDIVIECEAGGNPTPDITIFINDVKTGDTMPGVSRHSFQIGIKYSHINISCTAANKVSTVLSGFKSLQRQGKYH